MSTVHLVFVQTARPSGGSLGRVAEGHWTVVDDTVTLTDRDGTPQRNGLGQTYLSKLENGDSHKIIARRLLRENLSALDKDESDF